MSLGHQPYYQPNDDFSDISDDKFYPIPTDDYIPPPSTGFMQNPNAPPPRYQNGPPRYPYGPPRYPSRPSIPISTILPKISTEIEEKKCIDCEELTVIKTEKKSLQTLIEQLLNTQNQLQQIIDESKANQKQTETRNKDLTQQIHTRNTELSAKNNALQTENNQLTQQNITLKRSQSVSEQRIAEVQKANVDLNEECKQTKLELSQIKQKFAKLKRIKNASLDNYRNWSSEEFVDWIISLDNGKYAKYEKKLRHTFSSEDVDGSVIGTIEKSEWKDWGITNYKDRVNLDKHLKALIQKRIKPNMDNGNEGYDGTPYI